jgi:hypothetical protein
MSLHRINAVLFATLAYLVAAWAFTACLLIGGSFVGHPVSVGAWQMFLAAPVLVPLLTLQDPNAFMCVFLTCVLLTAFVIYRLIRRSFAPRPTAPLMQRTATASSGAEE